MSPTAIGLARATVDRDPWQLESNQLKGETMELAGESNLAPPTALNNGMMPRTFQLREGPARVVIHIAQRSTGQTWTA